MSLLKKKVGSFGEEVACRFLTQHRYKVIDRNFRTRNGEIDIIAIDTSEKEPVLVFIEVKTRKTVAFGKPFEAIHYYKLQAMMRTAVYYQSSRPDLPSLLRLDAVAITIDNNDKVVSLELLKNLF